MIPSPADLTYFIEIAQTQNVSRAAERLGISQPSLSLAMRRLEESVGAALFLRSKRGVTLTQAGRQLQAHSKNLLQTWSDIRTQALASVHEIQGSYTIGCHASMAMRILSSFLPDLMAEHPKLEIRLRHDISRKTTEDVISMKIDIGIVVNPVRHPDLVIHKLGIDEVSLFVSADRSNETQNATDGTGVLVCDPDLAQTQFLLKEMKKKGMVFGRTLPTGSLEVAADIVSRGCGIGILPSKVAERARQKLRRLPKAPIFIDDHCLIYRAENKSVRAMQVLNGAIKDYFGKSS